MQNLKLLNTQLHNVPARYLILVLLLVYSLHINAQNGIFSCVGVVTDSIRNPLKDVSVLSFFEGDTCMVKTDALGKFKVRAHRGGKFLFKKGGYGWELAKTPNNNTPQIVLKKSTQKVTFGKRSDMVLIFDEKVVPELEWDDLVNGICSTKAGRDFLDLTTIPASMSKSGKREMVFKIK